MKLEDLEGWHELRYTGTRESYAERDAPGTPFQTLLADNRCISSTALRGYPLPLAVLANHLRLLGWTVIPPESRP